MNLRLIIFILLLGFGTPLVAQTLSGGFKTGLNFSRFEGDLIEGPSGEQYESFSFSTGFHVGAIINLKFTDYFGLRGEILYSQKGSDYDYNGPSYLRLYDALGVNSITLEGTRNTTINVTNSYVDIPILAYLRFGRVEFGAGVSAGVMLGSRATGEVALREAVTPIGLTVEDVVIAFDANYFQDEFQITDFADAMEVRIQGTNVIQPATIGAYYDANDSRENLYKRLDLGLIGQVGFYLNQGLFLSLRANYGLSDVTNQSQDIDFESLNGNNVILRDDFDRNLSLQASIGFSF